MYFTIKRLFDIAFALSVLCLTSPILIIAMVLLRLETRGPIFFYQKRLGLNRKEFGILKLRTMTHRDRKIHEKIVPNHPEVTKVGWYLRRYKIDELPQFINVLMSDMSIVGPRPCVNGIEHLYNEDTASRFLVKPGVTSLAGVSGSIYLTWPEKWHYDKFYVENANFGLDIRIIVKTIAVVFLGEGRFLKAPGKSN